MDGRTRRRFRRRLQDELRQRGLMLEQMRRSVTERGTQAIENRHSFPSHLADMAMEEADRESDYLLVAGQGREVNEIEEALRRIDEGIYGTCESCGEKIDPRRLEVIPSARFCLGCKEVQERQLHVN